MDRTRTSGACQIHCTREVGGLTAACCDGDAFAFCRSLMEAKAKTFHFAALWLPNDLRRDVWALYAFFRTIDDLVDEPPLGMSTGDIQRTLDRWRAWLDQPGSAGGPVQRALGDVIQRRSLPIGPLHELIDGCESDLTRSTIADEAELTRYCYLVAGTVGISMAALMGARGEAALLAASMLGSAMQRTNIIRDVGEDAARGRVYLPMTALTAAGVGVDDVLRGQMDERLCGVLANQITQARGEYRLGLAGVRYLPRRSRLPIVIAGRLYERILNKVERSGYDVFRARAATGRTEKALVALRIALFPWQLGRKDL